MPETLGRKSVGPVLLGETDAPRWHFHCTDLKHGPKSPEHVCTCCGAEAARTMEVSTLTYALATNRDLERSKNTGVKTRKFANFA